MLKSVKSENAWLIIGVIIGLELTKLVRPRNIRRASRHTTSDHGNTRTAPPRYARHPPAKRTELL